MPQLNDALIDTTISTIFSQFNGEDTITILDFNDDAIIVYNDFLQLF